MKLSLRNRVSLLFVRYVDRVLGPLWFCLFVAGYIVLFFLDVSIYVPLLLFTASLGLAGYDLARVWLMQSFYVNGFFVETLETPYFPGVYVSLITPPGAAWSFRDYHRGLAVAHRRRRYWRDNLRNAILVPATSVPKEKTALIEHNVALICLDDLPEAERVLMKLKYG